MKRILVVLGLLVFCANFVFADEEITLEKIVVTPYRYTEEISKIPAGVNVITEKDIKDSNAKTIPDVLRAMPGLIVRDWYGNGVKMAVDIAGFGEQAAHNVLVLIDGRRVNDVDLSGVDWKQIPIERVERIEILRGGIGGVLYGENASSGVINIVTKKGRGKPKVDLQSQCGSYDFNAQKLSLEGEAFEKFSYWINAGYDMTHGYRKNSFVKDKDFGTKLSYDFTDYFSLRFESGFHGSSYGLPASLWQDYIDRYGRRYAKNGQDHANNTDYYFVTGGRVKTLDIGVLDIDFNFRNKEVDSYYPTSKLNTQFDKIESFGFTPRYTLGTEIFSRENKLIAGLDFYRNYYKTRRYNRQDDNEQRSFTAVNKNSVAGYIQDEFSLFKNFILVGGYRHEAARFSFAYHDFTGWNPDINSKRNFAIDSFDSGIVYNYQDESCLFLNVSKSFRFPQVDEFTYNDALWQQQLNTDLKPQTALNLQTGLRHKFSKALKAEFSLFRMKVKNELYYNSTGGPLGSGQNQNYDNTIHEGFDTAIETNLTAWLKFFGNYTFTKAIFGGGLYKNNDIPLVPRNKTSLGFRLSLPKGFTFNIAGNYVGKRYFLNDQANAYSKLNSYVVADANLLWSYKDLTLTFGINNLFNKKYSEYAGVVNEDTWESCSGITWPKGSKFYYPSPERNFIFKLNYSF